MLTIREIADAMNAVYYARQFKYINSDVTRGWVRYSYTVRRPSMSWSRGEGESTYMNIEALTNGTIFYSYHNPEEHGNKDKVARDFFSTREDLISKLPQTPEAFLHIINTRGKIESMEADDSLLKRIEHKVRLAS